MTSTTSNAGLRTAFRVDGTEHGGGGRFTRVMPRVTAALFTADADQVARLLPSPTLHPLRLGDGRTTLLLEAGECILQVGDLPPIRYGEASLSALVTHGPAAAPPMVPALGLILPLVGGPLNHRYGTGFIMLTAIVTNRVAAEIGRVLFGEPRVVGEIRLEQNPEGLHCAAADQDGATLEFVVPPGRPTLSATDTSPSYSARGSDLVRLSIPVSMQQSMRLGSSSARLDLGHHAWADLAKDVGMSARPWGSATWSDATETRDRLDRIGTTDHPPAPAAGPEPEQAPFVVRAADGTEEQVDQGLGRLPFDPAGDFQPAPD